MLQGVREWASVAQTIQRKEFTRFAMASGPSPPGMICLFACFAIAAERLDHRAMRGQHREGALTLGARVDLAIDVKDVFPWAAMHRPRFDLGQIRPQRRQLGE